MADSTQEYFPNSLIGILSSTAQIKKYKSKQLVISFLEANEKINAPIFFFTLKDVDIENRSIKGYYFDTDKGLSQKTFPYPAVLYNRVINFFQKKRYNPILESFRNENVIFFNPVGRFNKWSLNKLLNENEHIKKFIPHTVYFSEQRLETMLIVYQKVYVKGTLSGQGKQVIQVVKTSNNEYICRYYKNGLIEFKTESFKQLILKLEELLSLQKAVIQQMIDSKDKKIDLRVEAQRNKFNEIEIVGRIIRVGDKEAPILNTRSKPDFYDLDDFLLNQIGYSKSELNGFKKKLSMLVEEIYTTIEKEYGTFAQMGIDFILDGNYNFWLIESNATPGRKSLRAVSERKAYLKAYINVLEFSKWMIDNKNNR